MHAPSQNSAVSLLLRFRLRGSLVTTLIIFFVLLLSLARHLGENIRLLLVRMSIFLASIVAPLVDLGVANVQALGQSGDLRRAPARVALVLELEDVGLL